MNNVGYSTFPIRDQTKKGPWDYQLKKVYTIAILDFVFQAPKSDFGDVKSVIKLMNVKTKEVFYDKLTFIYLEMPRFRKSLDELETKFEKWLYILSNLEKLESIPKRLQEKIFMKVFEAAEIAKFTALEADSYEGSLKSYRDYTNTIETAFNDGKIEGKEEGKIEGKMERDVEIVKSALAQSLSMELIQQLTGLSDKEILKISDESI